MGESGERADIEKALIGSGLAARPHGISLRGAKTKGKCALKQNPNALHVACHFQSHLQLYLVSQLLFLL